MPIIPGSNAPWPVRGRLAILVTGASSGIGLELAREAARERMPLLLIARDSAALDALATELRQPTERTEAAQRGGAIDLSQPAEPRQPTELRQPAERPGAVGEAHTLALDLTTPGAVATIGAKLTECGLVCDLLVNNAGFGLVGAAAELAVADQIRILDLNLRVTIELALMALPGMLSRRRGGILNVGSVAGFMPGPGMAIYYASKAGLRSFSEALWAETRNHGVAVTLLAPGPVRTPFLERSGAATTRLFRMPPKATARHVAKRGWAGFRRGKRVVFPDALSWLLARVAPILPRRFLLGQLARLQRRR